VSKDKRYKCGALYIYVGFSERWGIELTYDFIYPALTIHVLNAYIVLEWRPGDDWV
jgi:hypothetical protein